jgi:hypothetical protein
MQLRSFLRDDSGTAKAALMKHIKQLVLTPEDNLAGRDSGLRAELCTPRCCSHILSAAFFPKPTPALR